MLMDRAFTEEAWEDYLYWTTQDKKTWKKLNDLIKDCCRSPFEGIGHPEPLKGDYTGWWSRKIDEKNRLIYRVEDSRLVILQCRTHYGDR
jgi:toxin YoeB